MKRWDPAGASGTAKRGQPLVWTAATALGESGKDQECLPPADEVARGGEARGPLGVTLGRHDQELGARGLGGDQGAEDGDGDGDAGSERHI